MKEQHMLAYHTNGERHCTDCDKKLPQNLPREFAQCDACYKKGYTSLVGIYGL